MELAYWLLKQVMLLVAQASVLQLVQQALLQLVLPQASW